MPVRGLPPEGITATVPFAPGRLSTTTGWPRVRAIGSATMRATASLAEPVGCGSTMRTGRFGKGAAAVVAGWARAALAAPAARASAAARARRVGVMWVPP